MTGAEGEDRTVFRVSGSDEYTFDATQADFKSGSLSFGASSPTTGLIRWNWVAYQQTEPPSLESIAAEFFGALRGTRAYPVRLEPPKAWIDRLLDERPWIEGQLTPETVY